ncbi:hypothetical protein Tcan_07996 [Toxocara canis]|uniref:Uncharacterized protein n=1 Tax=Toxocara canis TaxID=6265 RepID=A0A0B2VEQ2_TOXCA|nr:hypothetical protein Tcan_07996 [Toxocara canis]
MKKTRERRFASKSTATASRPKCEKRRTRERRRNSNNNRVTSTDGTTSGEEAENVIENCASGSRQTSGTHNGVGTIRRCSERTRIWIKCQSDLDADCEDNSTDFDSISHCALDSSPSHHKLTLPFESSTQIANADSSSNETESLREKIEHLETHVRKLTEENRMLSEENRRLKQGT